MLKFRQTIAAAIGAIGATVAYVPVHAALLPSVLIIVDEGGGASGAPVAQLQASGLFSSVTAFDENSGNPLPTLSNYSSILAYTDSIPNNQVGLGNALLSYVQGGGGLVLGAYALSPTWGILGGIMGAGYSPFTINTTTTVTGTLTAVVPGSYLFNGINLANLTYWSNSNYGNPTLNSGGTLLATDGNGVAMIGMNAAGNVIADNIFPNSDSRNRRSNIR